MRGAPLEGQIQAYWRACHDLRLAREANADDRDGIEDLADLADFTDHPPLLVACLSRLKCRVANSVEVRI